VRGAQQYSLEDINTIDVREEWTFAQFNFTFLGAIAHAHGCHEGEERENHASFEHSSGAEEADENALRIGRNGRVHGNGIALREIPGGPKAQVETLQK
jgi:hypothetical protein